VLQQVSNQVLGMLANRGRRRKRILVRQDSVICGLDIRSLEAVAKVSAPEIVSGASSECVFGVSSAVYANEHESELPFLKKWVRTRHALLFRLSNKTVQIVFFDRSEILLSSEARVVTYVAKQGERSEHSLEEVLQEGIVAYQIL
jgi:hypothetical protein